MELQQLRYFIALAQERHFRRAAARTHVTQPTLSQQIQKLEKELGAALFERSPRRVRLTQEGERFLPRAIEALNAVDRAAEEVRAASGGLAGRVVMGAIPTIGPYVLPRFVRALRQRAPDVLLELHDLTTSALLQDLKEGKLDLALLSLPITDSVVAVRSIGREPFLLAAAQRAPVRRAKRVNASALKNERLLILQEGHCFREQSLDYCRFARVHPQVVFQGSSLTAVMRMAAAGEGVTFVPKMAASAKENPGLAFARFAPPEPTREIGVAWRMSAPLTRAQAFVLELLEESLRAMLTPGERERS